MAAVEAMWNSSPKTRAFDHDMEGLRATVPPGAGEKQTLPISRGSGHIRQQRQGVPHRSLYHGHVQIVMKCI